MKRLQIGLVVLVALAAGCNDDNMHPTVRGMKDTTNAAMQRASGEADSRHTELGWKIDKIAESTEADMSQFAAKEAESAAAIAAFRVDYDAKIAAVHTRLEPFFKPFQDLISGLPRGASFNQIIDKVMSAAQEKDANARDVLLAGVNAADALVKAEQDKTDTLQDIAIASAREAAEMAASLSDEQATKFEEYRKSQTVEIASIAAEFMPGTPEFQQAVVTSMKANGYSDDEISPYAAMTPGAFAALLAAFGVLRTYGKSRSQGETDALALDLSNTKDLLKLALEKKISAADAATVLGGADPPPGAKTI